MKKMRTNSERQRNEANKKKNGKEYIFGNPEHFMVVIFKLSTLFCQQWFKFMALYIYDFWSNFHFLVQHNNNIVLDMLAH